MILTIDTGNTDTVFAIYNEKTWQRIKRIPTSQFLEVNSSTFSGEQFLQEHFSNNETFPESIIFSSVVPAATPALKSLVENHFGIPCEVLGPDLYERLPLGILNPAEIGSDLVANALAAWHHFQTSCVVVDFGTALTFTTLDRAGVIQGVAIAPGLKTAVHALFQNAAQLPEIPLEVPDSVLGKGTTHALQAGILLGYVGLVEGILDRLRQEMGHPLRVLATGGLSEVLSPLKPRFDRIDPMLTLEGLALVPHYSGSS